MLVLARGSGENVCVTFEIAGRPVLMRVMLVNVASMNQARLGFEAIYRDTGEPVPKHLIEIHREEIQAKKEGKEGSVRQ